MPLIRKKRIRKAGHQTQPLFDGAPECDEKAWACDRRTLYNADLAVEPVHDGVKISELVHFKKSQ